MRKNNIKLNGNISKRLKNYIVNQDQLFDEEFWLLKVNVRKVKEMKTKTKITNEKNGFGYNDISKKRISQFQINN